MYSIMLNLNKDLVKYYKLVLLNSYWFDLKNVPMHCFVQVYGISSFFILLIY